LPVIDQQAQFGRPDQQSSGSERQQGRHHARFFLLRQNLPEETAIEGHDALAQGCDQ
jgi:hypothetical protein